jgi:hypothetical protein
MCIYGLPYLLSHHVYLLCEPDEFVIGINGCHSHGCNPFSLHMVIPQCGMTIRVTYPRPRGFIAYANKLTSLMSPSGSPASVVTVSVTTISAASSPQDYLGTKALGFSPSFSLHVYLRAPVLFIGPLGRAINASSARRVPWCPTSSRTRARAICRAMAGGSDGPTFDRTHARCALVKTYARYH